ncbi:MAG: DUF2273 domain-containing protein [Microbacteriaceae bacterium]|nr:DUF2273 domain-containing protein [Microbacteriaceae bacterium]
MTPAKFGILIGAILALTWSIFGFWSFLFVAVAMVIGALVGRAIDGKLSVASLLDALRGKRSSS